MAEKQQPNYQDQAFVNLSTKLRDMEEKQRILQDRTILLGKNLIEIREKNNEEMLELKKEIEIIKDSMERLTGFLKTASAQFSKFAKKQDIEILTKQAKMFQPLEFIKRDELKNILENR